MLQEIVNGKSVIASKCFVNSAVHAEGTIATYMSLNLFKLMGDKNKFQKTILIFPGSEYTIGFFDTELSNKRTLTGIVIDIFGDDRTNQYLLFKYKESASNKKQTLVGSCGCIINNPSGSYDDYPTKTIAIQNIFDMQYGTSNPLYQNCDCDTDDSCCKGGWTTVLLGIDAEIVRAITINAKLLDDQCDNAVKCIELKTNGVYEIAYCKPGTNTVYEFSGRLSSIEPLEDVQIDQPNSIVHCNCQPKQENVGVGGSIYTSSGYHCDTDNFMSDVGPWTDVRLNFDTSEYADGDILAINLSWIRGMEDITPPITSEPTVPKDPTIGMECGHCTQNVLKKGIVIYTDEDGKQLKYYPLEYKMTAISVDGTETEIECPDEKLNEILNPIAKPEEPEIPITPPIGEVEVTPGEDDW